jgi:hypothetical protein
LIGQLASKKWNGSKDPQPPATSGTNTFGIFGQRDIVNVSRTISISFESLQRRTIENQRRFGRTREVRK